ncbi:hypothetical protein BDB00DRAFT_932398 [Zychaea mexicana]|uniref:uncharacterized protein n=1 Tax=Zychaea mexicana TaxID=64656 RepID=UPI0022FDD4D2|nr:uncharacterized protein BDB00DRAFT_932398 [Zychaea mexicana]KAI9488820.1 hypothetical protein BDB00DRAFT_932398 [Zychaea mexicana]
MVNWLTIRENFEKWSGAGEQSAPGIKKKGTKTAAYTEMAAAINEKTGVGWDWQKTKSRFESYKRRYISSKRKSEASGFGREISQKERKKGIKNIVDKLNHMCPYFYEMDSIFGQRENISPSTVLHAGLPPSISALAATLVPATELPAVETAVAATPVPTTATEELPTNHVVDENVPCSSFFEQADVDSETQEITVDNFEESMERFLEQAAPSPEPQNEEVNSIASSRVKSGSDDDDDNVPRGRNFTAVYSVNEAKRRKLESKKLKLEHERLQLEKARLAEQKRASQAQEQQTYASDRTKFFIELLKLGKTADEAKQIIENVYE